MTRLPGLLENGAWDLPPNLNMARQCLAHDPGKLAIRDLTSGETKDVTYSMLSAMTDALARRLLSDVSTGDRIGVLLSQSPWCVAAHLAIWKIGAISVPLFKLFQHDALATRVQDAGCKYVVTDAEGAALLGDLATAIIAESVSLQSHGEKDLQSFGDVDLQSNPGEFANTTPDTPAILIYTSGTTGKPKGALHGHRCLTGHLPGVFKSHNHLGDDGDMLWTPADWAWIGGLFDVALAGLAMGIPVVASRSDKFDPKACADMCAKAGIRNVFFPPTALRMLKAADQAIPGLRSIASGGEPLGAEMLFWGQTAFGLTINEFYGQTECNMLATSCCAEFEPEPGCIGKPVPGFDVAVLDAVGQPTLGEGDIAVKRGAASMMLEYWNQSDATQAKFKGDWMLTGDKGQWSGSFLRFIGREDDVITSSGYRIGPSEIEDCLLTHPAVATVGVVGKPDPLRTEIVKAYVVLRDGKAVVDDDLKVWVKERLSTYSYPREISFLKALPMTVTGKVIRKELKALAASENAP